MSKLPTISGKKFCKILEKLGFEKVYGKGSHIRYVHPDGRRTVVPVHTNENIRIGLLVEILKQVKISKDEYEVWRSKV